MSTGYNFSDGSVKITRNIKEEENKVKEDPKNLPGGNIIAINQGLQNLICFICQKELNMEYCHPFSCNHLICYPCVSKLLLRQNFRSLEKKLKMDEENSKITVYCICGNGEFSTDIKNLTDSLIRSFALTKKKEIKCIKHSYQDVCAFCKTCNKEICEKCKEDCKKDEQIKIEQKRKNDSLKNKQKYKNDSKKYKQKSKNDNIKNIEKSENDLIKSQENVNFAHEIIDINDYNKEKFKFITKDALEEIEVVIKEARINYDKFMEEELKIFDDKINEIILKLNKLKSDYMTNLKSKNKTINKILDLLSSTYKIFFKETEYDINEMSNKNYQLIKSITSSFKNIQYATNTKNFYDNIQKEIDTFINNFKSSEIELKLNFNHIFFSSFHEFIDHKDSINCLSILRDKYIISGSSDHSLKIWDSSKKNNHCLRSIDYHVDEINSILNIDDNLIISTGRDDKLCLWNINNLLKKIDENNENNIYIEKKPKKTIFAESICVYNLYQLLNGEIAYTGRDESVKIVDKNLIKKEKLLKGHSGAVLSICELANNFIVTGGEDSKIKIWLLNKEKCLDTYKGFEKEINCLLKLRNFENYFVAGSSDNNIKVLSFKHNPLVKDAKIENVTSLNGHTGPIYCLYQLLDERIASGSFDTTIRIWGINHWNCEQVLNGHKSSVYSLCQFGDGRLVSGGADKKVYLWE